MQRRRDDPEGAQRLESWLDGLRELFAERILAVGDREAVRWGELAGHSTLPVVDGLLAATALIHELTLVTRNTKDFARIDVGLLGPWRDGA